MTSTPTKPSIVDVDQPEDLDLDAFGLSTIISQKQKTCLDHAEAFYAQKDDWKHNHYSMVTTQMGEREIVCPYCNIKGPRHLILGFHLERCRQEYARVFLRDPLPETEDGSLSELEPLKKRQRSSLNGSLPTLKWHKESPGGMPTSPVMASLTPMKIDPKRCLYFLEKHRGNSCQNSQTGITITTPSHPVLRICDFAHIANEGEREVVFRQLREAIDGDVPFDNMEVCAECLKTGDVVMKATVGKRFGSGGKKGAPVRELHFCSFQCFSDYVVPLNHHRWNEMVKSWIKDSKRDED